ncbi:MAG TPA: 2-hydroxy-3-oxopropionate reductase [Sphingobium sp.]|nr:2-hydroxy-3-oxopropionate reductase [Sphingobium sp.]
MKIGFIGVGIMGAPMAGHLQAAGHDLFLVRHRSPLPDALITGGATVCATASDVARRADVIILMLPNTPDVDHALFGADGVASGLTPGKTVIDMSSIDPIETKRFGEAINGLGCHYADAPVSGGDVGARNASLTIMVGADEAIFTRIRPLLELMGQNITLIGPVGSGQIAKVANQIIVALTIEAVSEALVFASKAGADPATVRAALMGGFASSRILEVHGQRMIERSFAPGFRIGLHQKDLSLALASARTLGLALPNTATAQQLFSACVAQGGADWDHSAMVTAIEQLANHRLGPAD